MLSDIGIDPSEIVLLTPTKEATEALLGSDDRDVVAAAEAKMSLGPIISGRTRPAAVQQLVLGLGDGIQ